MSREPVTLERVGPVGIVTLNRPRVLNALSFQLTNELHEGVGLGYRAGHDNENSARRTRFQAPSVREGFKDFLARKGRS